MSLKNPFEVSGNWYRANLHTHTTTSDGSISPAERVAQYRQAGYDVLALTDHGKTNDVAGMSDAKMLVVSGIEYHPNCPTNPNCYHIVGLGVPREFAFRDPQSAQDCIDDIHAAGGVSFLGHPYWHGHTLNDFRNLKGLVAMEVFNSVCDLCGRGSSEHEWANALDSGMMLPCVGVDDVHAAEPGEEVAETWTMLKMPSRTVENVLEALRTGCCYATRGPIIHDFRVINGVASIRCSPARVIYLMSGPTSGRRMRTAAGQTVESSERELKPTDQYVRAIVIDREGRQAWTSPIFLTR